MVKNQPSTASVCRSYSFSYQVEESRDGSRSFFKVPADQRSVNPEVYKPHLFSFGPYNAAHEHCISGFRYALPPHIADPWHHACPFRFSPHCQAASADFTVEGESIGGFGPSWHASPPNSSPEGNDSDRKDDSFDSTDRADHQPGDTASLDGTHAQQNPALRNSLSAWLGRTLSISSSFTTRVSMQPSSCVTAVPNDGDHFKHLAARAVGLRDRTQLIDKIKQHDPEFRNMYVQMSQAQLDLIDASCLAELLALDGIAIVAATMPHSITDLIYPITRLILSDAILLENQVPVLVLKYALDSMPNAAASLNKPTPHTLEKVLTWYRDHTSPFPNFKCEQPPPLSAHMKESLLDHIYDYLTQAKSTGVLGSANTGSQWMLLDTPAMPTASHLARCGVRFRPCHASFKGIHFDEKNTVLSIPRIVVSDTTVRFLHNLLAYEATARYPEEFSVISYAHFMDRLIDTEDDCRVLVEAGVILNALGSLADLANMWNKLCTSVSCRITPEDCGYMKQLEGLTKRRLRRWRAAFKEKYWERQPWLLISLLAAMILLVLTFLQTIYTMKASFAPRTL